MGLVTGTEVAVTAAFVVVAVAVAAVGTANGTGNWNRFSRVVAAAIAPWEANNSPK